MPFLQYGNSVYGKLICHQQFNQDLDQILFEQAFINLTADPLKMHAY